MSKHNITQGFARTVHLYPANAIVQKQVSSKLALKISSNLELLPQQILEIGCGTGFLTTFMLELFRYSHFYINDLNEKVKPTIDRLLGETNPNQPTYLFGDAEKMQFTQQFDLIVSSSCIHWFNDIPHFLQSISKTISQNGIFAFSTFGVQNMKEIKQLTGNSLKYYNINDYAQFLSSSFEITYAEDEEITMYFEKPIDVLQHIKSTGVNGHFRQQWTKSRLSLFETDYQQLKTSKGFPLTYHPIYFVCKKL